MNRDLILNTSKFLTTRAKQFAEEMNAVVGDLKAPSDVLYRVFSSIRSFFTTLGKPTMQVRKVYDASPPVSSDINDTFREIYNDTRLAADEQTLLGYAFKQSFNYTTMEYARLRNRVKKIGEMVSDYIVLAKNTLSKCFILQDSFTDLSKTDMSKVTNPAEVHTKSGIITLGITGSANRSPQATVVGIKGEPAEAFPGNFLVVYKKDASQDKIDQLQAGQTGQEWALLYDTDPHADETSILDGNPDTWYEYQMINVPEEYKKPGANPDTRGYGWKWADGTSIYYGDRTRDSLRCIFTIALDKPYTINWIDLYPYFPDESCSLTINEVATSLTNSGDYTTCLIDAGDRGAKINANTKIVDIDFKDRQKFRGHGVWAFPARQAQYIKIDVSADSPYTCPVGHIYWEIEYDVVSHTTFLLFFHSYKTTHVKERIEGPKFDRQKVLSKKNYMLEGTLAGYAIGSALSFIGGPLGALIGLVAGLLSTTTVSIENVKDARMGLDVYQDGFRWCVGVRGIDIQSYQYAESSVYMSKVFSVPQGIREISLSVSELIPEEFYSKDLTTKNTWIRYYLSFDGGSTWHPICPQERLPVDGEVSPPAKVIAITSSGSGEEIDTKLYVTMDKATSVRLMAELTRPQDLPSMTPIIYDYRLRILPEDVETI